MATFEWPESKPISYRLYYNEDGTPKCYSMDDMPGKYIEVDSETFALRPWNVQVRDGKLHLLIPTVLVKTLRAGNEGIPCSPQDICVVVTPQQPHTKWKLITNETH